MNTAIQDAIEREVTIRASKERVFQAIIDPAQLVAWFPDTVEGKLEVGESPVFDFGKGHRYSVRVVNLDPHDYFAYRWVPTGTGDATGFIGDVLAQPNTLVEFKLETTPDGTRVVIRESGFAALLLPNAADVHTDHCEGWTYFANNLSKYISEN